MIYKSKEFIVKDNLKVIIKTPEISDAKELLEFIKTVADETPYLLSSREDFASFSLEKEESFIKANRDGNNYLLCAYVDNKIIGDFSINFCGHLKDKHRCSIGICIQKEYWNKGIGSLFFDEMLKLVSNKEGIEQIELNVNSKNTRAKALYIKKGFSKAGTIPRALKQKDDSYDDEEIMVRFLK